ncbi:hypothetical protein EAF04_010177 [Stromatinia cepivora]|nr:hypothetical protein EAF04_010177 [Stromatinia cepivora]
MYNSRMMLGKNGIYYERDKLSTTTAQKLVAKYFSDMNGQGIRRALTKLYKNTYVFIVLSSVGPQKYDMRGRRISWHNWKKAWAAFDSEDDDGLRRFLRELCFTCCIDGETRDNRVRVDLRLKKGKVVFEIKAWKRGDSVSNSSGEDEEEDKANKYRDDPLRVVMPIFEKMEAPQLRRIIHVICGGIYKLDFSAETDNINNNGIQSEDDDPETLCIDGTEVCLANEAETCEALEEMPASKLLTVLKSLCSGNIVFQVVKKKIITIDGTTITLQVEGWSKLENEDTDDEAKKAEALYKQYNSEESENEGSGDSEGGDGENEEETKEFAGDESPTRYFLSRKTLALKEKDNYPHAKFVKRIMTPRIVKTIVTTIQVYFPLCYCK